MSDITPMAAVPSEVNYGRIRANFVAFIADDNGNVLEEVPLEGNVILTPTVGVLRFPSTSPPRTAVIQTLQCPIIGGILYPPGTPLGGPFPSQTGVAAVASDQPAGLPTTVQWTASFSLENTSAQPNPVTFNVPANGVVDLTTVLPSTPTPGTVVVVSTESRDRAETAAATATSQATAAASSATAAKSSETKAEAARDTTLAAAILELRGTGFPGSSTETNTTPVGTYYTDTVGTNGAWRWLKTSAGSGVAQWTVMHGDTGWRDISSQVATAIGWELASNTPYLRIRRVGTRVSVTGRVKATKAIGAGSQFMTLPGGWRPNQSLVTIGIAGMSGAQQCAINNNLSTGLIFNQAFTAGQDASFLASYDVTDAWPTTLPGTPA